MSTPTLPIVYPESDGRPMAENTLQFQWIVTIKENLEARFRDVPDVFVAGDLFWYPVEGHPKIRQAPDTMVVIGRPKGHRRSYRQWEEQGIAPQVVFEVLSPGNRAGEMRRKLRFYERYGVEEYYIYDPDNNRLIGYQRTEGKLTQLPNLRGWVSPQLGIRFEPGEGELQIFYPDGRVFLTFVELYRLTESLQHAQQEKQRADRLAAQLRALGIEPEA